MLPECPPDLRPLLPYLQRASELRGREPIVAYYCRAASVGPAGRTNGHHRMTGGFYAAHLALAKGYPKSASNDAFLMNLFDELERVRTERPARPHADGGRTGKGGAAGGSRHE